jgi:sec-independent protein translocase protein TatA
MGSLSPVHWAIVVVVVLLLFGSRKLPDMARGVGQSMRILKAETRGMQDDDTTQASSTGGGNTTTGDSDPTSSITGATSERPSGTTHPVAGREQPPSADRDAS